MYVIEARNVHQALPEGIRLLSVVGQQQKSRNGPVIVAPGPVTTVYRKPKERALFWACRDANPFFHLMESLWMLAGRNDVDFVANYAGQMRAYSDDGETLHGAYGHRWIKHFGFDQLFQIAKTLRVNPTSRRCVLAMWDAPHEQGGGLDLPCNTHAYFSRNFDGGLDMTVCCRSNDIVWGAYGANAVHFSYLQEFLAKWIGCQVGQYWQISNNFHAYLDTYDKVKDLADAAPDGYRTINPCPYAMETVRPFPLISTPPERWRQDLAMFLSDDPVTSYRDPFFRLVVAPMMQAHQIYKGTTGHVRYKGALDALKRVAASDWKLAAEQWIRRRKEKFLKAADDGPNYEEN